MPALMTDEQTQNPAPHTTQSIRSLATERSNEASEGLDTKSSLDIARIINAEDAKVAAAVKKSLPEIAQAIDAVARCLRDGGRLIYVGAGSSGRIAALDSAECPAGAGAIHHVRRSQSFGLSGRRERGLAGDGSA